MVDRSDDRSSTTSRMVGLLSLRWVPLIACNALVLTIASICYAVIYVEVDLNPCIITYMYPNYYRIQGDNFSRFESKYELHLYKEGPNVRKEFLPLRGVPILFIHGNAGTYKQVRSFGAEMHKLIGGDYTKLVDTVTGQKYENSFDFFAVHFQEEFSALEGNVMMEQTEFVNDCIRLILKLYASPENMASSYVAPTSVILLAHSMGGFVARAVLTLSTFERGSVNTIITLNTPHKIAPVYLHHSTATLYYNVNEWWVEQFKAMELGQMTALDDVVIVSICGGHRDTLIRSELASLEGLVPATHGISTLTTAIPNAWLEADHQCILWCQQFLHVMLRSALGMIDPRTRQNTHSRADRLQHLTDTLTSATPQRLGLLTSNTPDTKTKTDTPKISKKSSDELVAVAESLEVYPLPNVTHSSKQTVLNVKFNIQQWLEMGLDHFVLLSDARPVNRAALQAYLFDESYLKFVDFTPNNIILPPVPPLHKPSSIPSPSVLTYLSPSQMEGYKYLVIIAASQQKKHNFLIAQFYNAGASTFTIKDIPLFPQKYHLSGHALLNKFVINSHHKHTPLVARLTSTDATPENFLPLTYQLVNQPMIESKFITNSVTTKVKFHQSTKEPSYLLLLADPHKDYELSIGLDWRGMLGQYSRAYMLSLVGCVFAVCLFTISRQLYVWRTNDDFPHFLVALRDHFNRVGLVFVVVLPLVGSMLPQKGEDYGFLLPDPFLDQFLNEHSTPYWIFPFVYMAAVAIVTILGILSWSIFVLISFLDKAIAVLRGAPPLPVVGTGSLLSSWALYPIIFLMLFLHSSIPLTLATLYLPFITRSSSYIFASLQPPNSQPQLQQPTPAQHPSLPFYHHSLFIMFALTVGLTMGSMLLWVHHLLAGMYRYVPVYDGYEWVAALVLVHVTLASHSMVPRKGLSLDVVTFVAGLYCLEYAQLLSYRAMYSIYVVTISFIFCHILSLKKKSS